MTGVNPMDSAGRIPNPTDMLRLDGKVALVTGASRGIGKATAALLARAGARVALVSRSQERLDTAIADIATDTGGDLRCYVANAGDQEQVLATVNAVKADFGRIDILVNNAATNPYFGPLVGLDVARAMKTTQVNVVGPLIWTQSVWDQWMCQHGGAVVNVASLGAYIVEQGAGYYASTKAALVNLTRQFAAELGPGVRVNAIAPGLVKTEMARVLWETKGDDVAAALPLARLGEPEDIAAAVLFLVSGASSWMTGETLVVDGGALSMPLSGMDR
ncbi:NAD(P)-dependent dehydrogenase, short-chain alcohol dehydrogenase family [Amycolatopsis marina]|uniref:NAD(P)-dependent dehydrogenase, short-chain alcohol dehydrogenase family n=2 Tax=Amycolatopsis marina TaxID=490629 RepID=A0A1I1C2U6_9PSEU|nr:NAD(P)-dependent dehydrogenase, short-chain alcohol dehydrogenase family [Amycolatopsis marina]